MAADFEQRGGAPFQAALAALRSVVGPTRETLGWATVELDRAEREVPAALEAQRASAGPAPEDEVLGARARMLDLVDGRRLVLLEPSREGLLAAALARHDEGPLVLYLEVDAAATDRARAAGFILSAAAGGPLGPQRRVIVGPRDGPFVLLVPR